MKLKFSIIQCFLSKTRWKFDELCKRLREDITSSGNQSLFEITENSQIPWQSNVSVNLPQTSSGISTMNINDFSTRKDGNDDSEEDFEYIL